MAPARSRTRWQLGLTSARTEERFPSHVRRMRSFATTSKRRPTRSSRRCSATRRSRRAAAAPPTRSSRRFKRTPTRPTTTPTSPRASPPGRTRFGSRRAGPRPATIASVSRATLGRRLRLAALMDGVFHRGWALHRHRELRREEERFVRAHQLHVEAAPRCGPRLRRQLALRERRQRRDPADGHVEHERRPRHRATDHDRYRSRGCSFGPRSVDRHSLRSNDGRVLRLGRAQLAGLLRSGDVVPHPGALDHHAERRRGCGCQCGDQLRT